MDSTVLQLMYLALDTADLKEMRKLQIIQQIESSCMLRIYIDKNSKMFYKKLFLLSGF